MNLHGEKRRLALAALLFGLFLAGCASGAGGENTEHGFTAIANLEYESALSYFTAAEENGEEPSGIARGRGIALLGLARFEEAEGELVQALSYSDAYPDDFDYDTNYYLATAYFKQGKYEEASQVYTAILALSREKEAYYYRGVTWLELGEEEKAELDFEEAILLAPTDLELRIMIFQAQKDKGYEEEGKVWLQAALNDSAQNLSNLDKGRLSFYLEDYEGARSYLESDKGEKDAETALLLGQTYEQLGDYNYAASIYSNYLADHSEDAVILNRLGVCKLEAGEPEAALDYFNRALELTDSTLLQTLKFNQIVAYEHLGEFDQARVLMKAYLQLYPDDEAAVREYEFLSSR